MDSVGWLLEPGDPAVRHLAQRQLSGRPEDDPDVVESRRSAMTSDPIASILAAQHPSGYWEKPGPGYGSKYRGTVWQLTRDARLRPAIEWLQGKQDDIGRWRNESAFNGKTWVDIEPQGRPSKWVTLRASRVLRAALG